MNILKFEDRASASREAAESKILQGMMDYNQARANVNVIELIKDVWEDVGFDPKEIDIQYPADNGFVLQDPQLGPLDLGDFEDLASEIQDAVKNSGLGKYIKVLMARMGAEKVDVEVQCPYKEEEIKQFYKLWTVDMVDQAIKAGLI